MTDMVERMAESICVTLWGPEVWAQSKAGDPAQAKSLRGIAEECRTAARAAIEAMREPTPAMLSEFSYYAESQSEILEGWQAAIAVALKT